MSHRLDVSYPKQGTAIEFCVRVIKMKVVELYMLWSTRFLLLKMK
jgi:hypothetical protein